MPRWPPPTPKPAVLICCSRVACAKRRGARFQSREPTLFPADHSDTTGQIRPRTRGCPCMGPKVPGSRSGRPTCKTTGFRAVHPSESSKQASDLSHAFCCDGAVSYWPRGARLPVLASCPSRTQIRFELPYPFTPTTIEQSESPCLRLPHNQLSSCASNWTKSRPPFGDGSSCQPG